MGTNFYFEDPENKREIHIGKRSAAGMFCTQCGMSLADSAWDNWDKKHTYGVDAVHNSAGVWLKNCPLCGRDCTNDFTCSFSFAIRPSMLYSGLHELNYVIKDEYGTIYSRDEFIKELQSIHIKKYKSIGVEFC